MNSDGPDLVSKPRKDAETAAVYLSESLFNELIHACVDPLPDKAYGLVGGEDPYHPKSIYPCSTNLRNEPEWKAIFESYGKFYLNPDHGFVISAQEVQEVQETMASRGESFIGVYHSHRYRSAEPSPVDMALNMNPSLLSYIVSVVDPAAPVVRAFRPSGDSYENIPILRMPESE